MRISREDGMLSRDCQIPARFIRDEMKALDGRALKLYLFLHLLTLEGEGRVNDEDLGRELGFQQDDMREAVSSLLRAGLITVSENNVELRDYHRLRLEKEQQLKQETSILQETGDEAERRKNAIIRQINDTFFHGNMPLFFYNSIESWFTQYGFAPEVAYMLIREAHRNNGLQNSSYADAIARRWSENGVITYADLNTMSENDQKMRQIATMMQKKLRIGRPNDYQMKAIRRWIRDWKFGEEALDEAMRRASLNGRPSFQYIEGILKSWHEAGVTDLQDILRFEESRRDQSQRGKSAAVGAMGNFSQREYSEDDIESLDYVPGIMDSAEWETSGGQA